MDRTEELRDAGANFKKSLSCRVISHDLFFFNWAEAASLEAVSLRMMSNNCRSAPIINPHLPIEEASQIF
jgi:hypothetical protein